MKKLTAAFLMAIVALAGPAAFAGDDEETYCEENNKRNGQFTDEVHEIHDIVEPISAEGAEIIHDEVEPRTCEG